MPRITPRSAARRRPARSAGALRTLAMLALAGLSASCQTMSDVDRAVDRLVEQRSGELGGGTVAPPPREPVASSYDSPSQNEKKPPSTNPPAEAIPYAGADAGRDVLARLDHYSDIDPGAQLLTFQEALRRGQQTGREYLTAEEEYILAAIRLLIERHLWGPRFFDDISANVSSLPVFGDYDSALTVINELRATQRLPYGGEVEARLITSAVEQLTGIVGDRYTQSTQLVLSGSVPFLRNAGLIAQEDLIQAEREVVYAARTFEDFRRSFLVDLSRDYFDLLAQAAVIKNQEDRLKSIILFYEQTKALVEAGRNPPFQARNVEQNVLASRNELINQREAFLLSLDRFKVRLGIPVQESLVLQPISLELDDPDVSVSKAVEVALLYRLDLQNEVDRVDDARRGEANARNQLLPDLNATASAALNSNPRDHQSGLSLDLGHTEYRAGITFGLPLDREIERLQLRQSIIALQQQARQLDQFRDNLILDVRRAVREIDRARFSLKLQEQAVEINTLRLEELRIKADEVDTQTRLDAENELLRSRNERDQAVRDLRIAILDYLRRTGQLRVARDGNFQPLQGMVVRLAPDTSGNEATPAEPQPGPLGPVDNPLPPPGEDTRDVPEDLNPPALPPAAEPVPPQNPPRPDERPPN